MQKVIENKFIRLFSFKRHSKTFLISCFLISFFIFDLSKAQSNNSTAKKKAEIVLDNYDSQISLEDLNIDSVKQINTKNKKQLSVEYLEPKNELEDYIIDTGDQISLDFYPAAELSGVFSVSEEGELLLPRLDETFVRGLTKSELKTLLEKRYDEFLIDPEIKVRILVFKSIRVLTRGELRNPGFYKFPAYKSDSEITLEKNDNSELDLLGGNYNEQSDAGQNLQSNNQSSQSLEVKRASDNLTTISDVIRKAGGITSKTDLSRIEIIRDVPLGKGGGKKKAIIDFNAYIQASDATNDIRIFDGDILFFPTLRKSNPNQIPKSILSGISPKFISVNLFGRVDTPGEVKLPLESTLSDAIDLSGPIKPLSGKIVLIRYEKDGKVIKKNISYSASAKRGSKRNPYLKEDDLISVKNSFLGKTTGVIREFTAPFVGIYSTKEIIEGFSD